MNTLLRISFIAMAATAGLFTSGCATHQIEPVYNDCSANKVMSAEIKVADLLKKSKQDQESGGNNYAAYAAEAAALQGYIDSCKEP
jgi:hypothetical protein